MFLWLYILLMLSFKIIAVVLPQRYKFLVSQGTVPKKAKPLKTNTAAKARNPCGGQIHRVTALSLSLP